MLDFASLHNHCIPFSHDSRSTLQELVKASAHYKAFALTDHLSVAGWSGLEQIETSLIKLYGMEANLIVDDKRYHITLVARNDTGKDLIQYIARSSRGIFSIGDVDTATFDNLSILSGCMGGYVGTRILSNKAQALDRLVQMQSWFTHLYLEVSAKGTENYYQVVRNLVVDSGVTAILTLDTHSVSPAHSDNYIWPEGRFNRFINQVGGSSYITNSMMLVCNTR